MHTDETLSLELDFAKLSLVGKRFIEADNKYRSILKKNPTNSGAWCGLGLAKYGQLIDSNSTVEEVFYCFNKAKSVDPDAINEIENLVLDYSFEVIKTMYEYYVIALNFKEQANQQMALSLLAGAVSSLGSALSKDKNNSLSANLASLGGTAISYGSYVNAKNTQLASEEQQKHIKNVIKIIIENVLLFVNNQQERITQFSASIETIQRSVKENIPTEILQISKSEALQLEQKVLYKRSKNWKTASIIFFIFSLAALIPFLDNGRLSGDPIASFVTFFSIGIVAIVKSTKFKKEASEIDIKLLYAEEKE